jgi:hypothetical protein
MSHVSKEMVYAVKMARWSEWERMAKQLPPGRHILSVELLRSRPNETTVVLTVVHNHRLVQYELRGDIKGRNVKPYVSQQRGPSGCDPQAGDDMPRVEALLAAVILDPGGDGGSTGNGIALGEPPPKEDPLPGVLALGTTLLGSTYDLGEQAVNSDNTPPPT